MRLISAIGLIRPEARLTGTIIVDARFNAFRCLTNGEDKTRVSYLVFKVTRGGRETSIRHARDSYGHAPEEYREDKQ